MELGMIGLGGMGSNRVQHFLRAGHHCAVFDLHSEALQALVKADATGAYSLEEFASELNTPRTIWMMVLPLPLTRR